MNDKITIKYKVIQVFCATKMIQKKIFDVNRLVVNPIERNRRSVCVACNVNVNVNVANQFKH